MLPLKKDLKLMRSLHQKKFRNETGLFIVEGKKMVEEAIQSDFDVHSIYTTDPEWKSGSTEACLIPAREMETISGLTTPAGYIAAVHQSGNKPLTTTEKFVFVLDGINDPGNLGTILRTADWFGVKSIICTPETVDVYNPKVVQSTMGSIFNTRLHYLNVEIISKWANENGYTFLGADLSGADVFGLSFPTKTAMVIGSESHGIRDAMRAHIRQFVHIPGNGKAESLNAGVAAAIVVSQWFRTKSN
ncbi:MAG: TrmH family RNA methyltransferase [Flavobacteriales bacterium]